MLVSTVGPQGAASRLITGASLPATCSPGQVFVVPGTGMYVCFATNTWTLLDSSISGEVTGSGTTNQIVKWSNGAGSVIANSSISDNGTTFAINTNKFTVTEATGATVIGTGATTSALTDLLINPTTKASGKLIDAQVNSVSKFSVGFGGQVLGAVGAVGAPTFSFIGSTDTGIFNTGSIVEFAAGATLVQRISSGGVFLPAGNLSLSVAQYMGFTVGVAGASAIDSTISRNAAGVIQFGTTAANASGSILATNATFSGYISNTAPVTKNADFTWAATENWIISDRAATNTATLPAAASFSGRILHIKTIQAQTVVSASSNVVPLAGGAAGTAILAATAGKWATLVSDGANWIIVESN